jgi:glutamyl-tRNA reductase
MLGTGSLTPVSLGVDHTTAPLAIRERITAVVADLPTVLGHLRSHAAEAAVLFTCNRTEFYLVGAERVDSAVACVASAADLPEPELSACQWRRTDSETVAHLFAVAAGIESQLLGETDILRQLRVAQASAHQLGATGPVLSALFRYALRFGKRVRAKTGISRSAASVGSAAAAIVRQELPPAARGHAVVVGAGHAAERLVAHLRGLGFGRVDVVNRTIAHANRLVTAPGQALTLDALAELLAEADVLLSATTATCPIVRLVDVAGAMRRRRGRPLLLDLAVPRDIEPAVADLPGVRLHDIDAIHARAAADRARRGAEVSRIRELMGPRPQKLPPGSMPVRRHLRFAACAPRLNTADSSRSHGWAVVSATANASPWIV